MRLLERTLKMVQIAPREIATDALGGRTEKFSSATLPVRASVIPYDGGLENRESGLREVERLRLLMPLDAQIRTGDGVCIDEVQPGWRCLDVQRWSGHLAVRVERIAERSAC